MRYFSFYNILLQNPEIRQDVNNTFHHHANGTSHPRIVFTVALRFVCAPAFFVLTALFDEKVLSNNCW